MFFLALCSVSSNIQLNSCNSNPLGVSDLLKFSDSKNTPAGKIAKNTHTGGVYFYLIGTQNTIPFCQKYTPTDTFLSDFAGWDKALLVNSKGTEKSV